MTGTPHEGSTEQQHLSDYPAMLSRLGDDTSWADEVASWWEDSKADSAAAARAAALVAGWREEGDQEETYYLALQHMLDADPDRRLDGVRAMVKLLFDAPALHNRSMQALTSFLHEWAHRKVRDRTPEVRLSVLLALDAVAHRPDRAETAVLDLSGLALRSAYLSNASFSGALLTGADLSGADLSGADLSGADLRRACLRKANLSGACLRDANLVGAELTAANLHDADLHDVAILAPTPAPSDSWSAAGPGFDHRMATLLNGLTVPATLGAWRTPAHTWIRRVEPNWEACDLVESAVSPAGEAQQDPVGLVARSRRGDERAFETLYRWFFDDVYRYSLVLSRDGAAAQDIAAETFYRALKEIKRAPVRYFRPWLLRLARDQVMRSGAQPDCLVTNRRRTTPADLASLLLPGRDDTTHRLLLVALFELPPQPQECLALRFINSCDHDTTAHIMGATLDEVKCLEREALAGVAGRLAASPDMVAISQWQPTERQLPPRRRTNEDYAPAFPSTRPAAAVRPLIEDLASSLLEVYHPADSQPSPAGQKSSAWDTVRSLGRQLTREAASAAAAGTSAGIPSKGWAACRSPSPANSHPEVISRRPGR